MKVLWTSAMKSGGVAFAGTLDVSSLFRNRKDVVHIAPLQAEGMVTMKRPNICEVNGTATTNVQYRCVRCLTEFTRRLDTSIDEVLSRVPLTEEQEEAELIYVPEEAIDLDPLIEQAVVLNLDVQPLCQEECRGLCSVCGADLNVATCVCHEQQVDPRLQALSQFYDTPKTEH
ncbi:YceD family protein [Sulfoacidibacillus thermotolerans]|nr:DUF177 domain-containing protein [Sulfoacidibacillus thermotolerans]